MTITAPVPSIEPSNIPSNKPSGIPTSFPTNMPSVKPSLTPTIDYFELFNVSHYLDILFNSTIQKYNSTNLEMNVLFQNNMTSLLQEITYLFMTDAVVAIKISKIWANYHNYNGTIATYNYCKLHHTDTYNNQQITPNVTDVVYSSWIQFEIRFNNTEDEEEWQSDLDDIINIFGNELKNWYCFINDTISISYVQCELDDSPSDDGSLSENKKRNLSTFSLFFNVCVIAYFACIAFLGYIDAKYFRRNETFSVGSVMSAATYTVDIVSGMCKNGMFDVILRF